MNAPELNDPYAFLDMPISIDEISASPTNPRKTFPEAEMTSLAESVKKHGVLQPVLLRPWPENYAHQGMAKPRFELVAGERRWRAAKAGGLSAIPARIRELTDHEVLEIQIIENLQREGLHPIEEAEGYETMMQQYGYTADTLADKVGKSRAYIYGRLKLTELCHQARKAFREGKLNPSTALLVARIPSTRLQEKATGEITDPDWRHEPMSVRAAADHIHKNYMLRLVEAPFPTDDVELVSKAGPCSLCPKRTGNQPADLFDDVKSADVCTDPECYAQKRTAHVERVAKAAKAEGKKVITGKAAEKIIPYGDTYNMGGGLVDLDRKCYDDAKNRTYREILADTDITVTLVENRNKNAMVEAVEQTQLAQALKAAGIKSSSSEQAAKQKKLAAKVDAERAYRQRLHANVRAELLNSMSDTGRPQRDDLVLIVSTVFSRWWNDHQQKIVKLWGAEKSTQEAINAFADRIPTLPDAELYLLLLDLSLISDASCNEYSLDSEPTKLLAMAKRFGLDPAEIRKEVAAEARGKAKPPTKAAQAGKPTARAKGKEASKAEAKPAAADGALAIGDRVRVAGEVAQFGGVEGIIEQPCGKKFNVIFEIKGKQIVTALDPDKLEKLPPATQAAPAAEQNATKEAAPAALNPSAAWPFPRGKRA